MPIKVLENKVEAVQKEIKPSVSKIYIYIYKLRKRKPARKLNIQVAEAPEWENRAMDKQKLSKRKHQAWFMLRFDRKQQNSVKQLSFNKKIN